MHRSLPVAISLAVAVTLVASPTVLGAPPSDPCGQVAYREAEQLEARTKTLSDRIAKEPFDAKRWRAEIREIIMDVPTGYVMVSPGRERMQKLLDATDASAMVALLGDVQRDLADLRQKAPWQYRCEAYPHSHLPPAKLDAKDLAARKATAAWAKAQLARAAECAKLQGRVLELPERERHPFTAALDRCYQQMDAAQKKCEQRFDAVIHGDAYAAWRVENGLSNLRELRRDTRNAEDVAAATARAKPMLDALRPPLSQLPAVADARAALARPDPTIALEELAGAVRELYDPCARLGQASPARCIVSPHSCEKKPN